jgi:ABC-type bacteriocin/lantibiotic exporter with double-glycine peptidase domain
MSVQPHAGRRRFFIPEVIQTSGMDCGPAALTALLAGFNAPVSYGRLREACHTDVDGTSIDTLEQIGQALGLDAEQIMLPRDHVLLDDAHALPAIAVVRTATGSAHFAVIWRVVGPYVQIMDPARGRMWLRHDALIDRLFQHAMPVRAADWRTWAASPEFIAPLTRRLATIGMNRSECEATIRAALADPLWHSLALLDACVRLLHSLVASGAVRRGHVHDALQALTNAVRHAPGEQIVPNQYWSVAPAPAALDGSEQVLISGAVVVRTRGMRHGSNESGESTRSPELAAALKERTVSPLRHVAAAIRAEGVTPLVVGAAAICIAAVGVGVEAMLLRSVLDLSTLLNLPEQMLTAGVVITVFAASMLGLELVLALLERRAGNHLEGRLRMAFLEKLPRLSDAYFQSRPMSDMLERSHNAHILRTLPQLVVRCARVAAELLVTTVAIAWLSPRMAIVAVVAAVLAAGIPLAGNTLAIDERDLRVRTHAGALARFHLDALLGRTAIESHGAEAIIEREHDRLLGEWAGASQSLQRASVFVEGVQMLVGFAIAGWILLGHFSGESTAATLLLTYWILNVPALGYELALAAREYPAHRSTILRILEPLSAPEVTQEERAPTNGATVTPIEIEARRLTVRVSGHQILDQIDVHIAAGGHVAILGASGAGKSTLVGALLGWYRPDSGELLVDGEPLTPERIDAVRRDTAWVDPTVQIWNRSLLDNLVYGSEDAPQLAPVLEAASLMSVVGKLADGLATPLGEGGKLLSAGEGQRVRLGRAMVKQSARLVILDEPFLGLERERRRILLAQTRQRWAGKTLLYVTHDVSEARGFERVLILDRGRIVEDGDPMQLSQTPSSKFRRLLQAQEAVLARLTTGSEWRRIRLESGRIVHEHGNSLEQRA